MDKTISNKMKPEKDSEYCYPIADCPLCGKKDVPFGDFNYISSNNQYIVELYCLNCHRSIDRVEPKGFVSLLGLEEMEWDTEL